MACQSQRGLPLLPTNDHISSISASASPARSMATAMSSGLWVRRNVVFTASSTVAFFLSSRSTVLGQICRDRAVSRIPLALRLMSMIVLRRITFVPKHTGPLGVACVAVARLGIVGRFDPFGSRGQFLGGLEPHAVRAASPCRAGRGPRPFIVALPCPTQALQDGQLPRLLRGVGSLEGVQELEAILADRLRIGL